MIKRMEKKKGVGGGGGRKGGEKRRRKHGEMFDSDLRNFSARKGSKRRKEGDRRLVYSNVLFWMKVL